MPLAHGRRAPHPARYLRGAVRRRATRQCLLAGLIAGPAAAAGATEDMPDLAREAEVLTLIADFADTFCKKIPLRGKQTSGGLGIEVTNTLQRILRKLVDLGVSAAANLSVTTYEGVARDDLLTAVETNTNCRLTVFHDLKRLLMAPETPASPLAGIPLSDSPALSYILTFSDRARGLWDGEYDPRWQRTSFQGGRAIRTTWVRI